MCGKPKRNCSKLPQTVTARTMKVLVVLLGLITATLQSGRRGHGTYHLGGKERGGTGSDCGVPPTNLTGGAATKVRIRAYNATGELDISKNEFILGTRVLLTCDVSGLPQGGKVFSYRWYHSCTGGTQGRCQIRDRDPYYKVVNDTLLADVTAWDHGGKYSCFVTFSNKPQSSYFTPKLTVAGWFCTCTKITRTICYLTPLVPTQVALFPSYTPPPPSSLSTLSSLMYNRQQGGMDNSGYHAGVVGKGPGLRFGWGMNLFLQTVLITLLQLD